MKCVDKLGINYFMCIAGDLRKLALENCNTAEEWLVLTNGWESALKNETAVKRYISLNHVYTAAFQVRLHFI
jgi:hypothetical protein